MHIHQVYLSSSLDSYHFKRYLNDNCLMSTKILDNLTRKLKQGQIIVDVLNVYSLSRSDKRNEQSLAICSLSLYFMQGTHLKKTIPIETIKQITLSTFSNELVIHCSDQDIWLQTFHSVKVIKNILKIRQRIFHDNSPLTIALEKQKSLQHFAAEQSKLRRFFQGVFGKRDSQQIQRQSDRKSYCTLQVRDRDFVMMIGRAIYHCNYKNAQLLYISGSNGFIFNEFDHIREVIDQQTFLFQHKETKDYSLMRRIPRSEDEQGKTIRKILENYKLEDFNEQILFAIQSAQYYQVITPYSKEQGTLEQLLNQERIISQLDMVSIFYKLVSLARSTLHPCYSLSPVHIIIKETVILSSIFCLNANRVNTAYLAPEQLDSSLSQRKDAENINLWKIGMLLYQTAFMALPFPIQFLAQIVYKRKAFALQFPKNHARSDAFLDFLKCVLVIDPQKRGGGPGWQKNLFNHHWIIQCRK